MSKYPQKGMRGKIKYKQLRINGWASEEGNFFKHLPTGTFGHGCYPNLHRAYLIIKIEEQREAQKGYNTL